VLVHLCADIGAATAALAGGLAVWGTSYVFALLHGIPTPPLSLLVKPLTLALALGFSAQALALDPWVGACAALVLYLFSAPILDRVLISARPASAEREGAD